MTVYDLVCFASRNYVQLTSLLYTMQSMYWTFRHTSDRLKIFVDVDTCSCDAVAKYLLSYSICSLESTGDCLNRNTETFLRCMLQCYFAAFQSHMTTAEVPRILWDLYAKHLNDSFFLGPEIGDIAVLPKNPRQWLQSVQRIGSPRQLDLSLNSFEMFLAILASHCNIRSASGVKVWNQMKGRIFTKFYARKVEELSERGLYNVLSLFLVLALHTVNGRRGGILDCSYAAEELSQRTFGNNVLHSLIFTTAVILRGGLHLSAVERVKSMPGGSVVGLEIKSLLWTAVASTLLATIPRESDAVSLLVPMVGGVISGVVLVSVAEHDG
ncbi:unnamed protein product [Soboliphyme baturini]|uniref:MMS22L_N domain-containing protein n=1 Tax=Soboliphyme baturini TaxID=241478 RepID=A0A183IE84_9BILA|nr:unnamed protein product [Soboliphyme baturini]